MDALFGTPFKPLSLHATCRKLRDIEALNTEGAGGDEEDEEEDDDDDEEWLLLLSLLSDEEEDDDDDDDEAPFNLSSVRYFVMALS